MNRADVLENVIRGSLKRRVHLWELRERKDGLGCKWTQAASELRARLKTNGETVKFTHVKPVAYSYYSIERIPKQMTQKELIEMIPCHSNGIPRNERLVEIRAILERTTIEPQNLKFFEQEINLFVDEYGHKGKYPLKNGR